MKRALSRWALVPVVCTLLVAAAAYAQNATKPGKGSAPPPSPEMEAAMKAGMPGEAHKTLDPLEGNWKATVKTWHSPAEPPMESKATIKAAWIMGGRFIEEKFQGKMGDMKFEGRGFYGYDNLRKTYVGSWMDSLGTYIMVFDGSSDDGGKTITWKGQAPDPMTGKLGPWRSVTRFVSKDEHVYEMYGQAPDGTEMKMMEITYTRK